MNEPIFSSQASQLDLSGIGLYPAMLLAGVIWGAGGGLLAALLTAGCVLALARAIAAGLA